MEMLAALPGSARALAGGLLLLLFAYLLVRAISHAFFRTKLEYLRSLRELRKEKNGHG